jgi:hypothetical protein
MAKRDPAVTARNKQINELTAKLKKLLPDALAESGLESDKQINAKYGGKFADYIDIANEVIHSPDHFVGLYLKGFKDLAEARPQSAHGINFELLKKAPKLRDFLLPFLRRVYLRNYEALSKKRPLDEDAVIWIGQNNADYGLLVTPRWNVRKNDWENDRSEIRHFDRLYWSIGHVLKTGLVIPGKNEKMTFNSIDDYLKFFRLVIVRNSGSKYEKEIAQMYCDYVQSASAPLTVPLLIPEFRYEGQSPKHKYRLDFTIITNPELNKFGFELSPWSTHGYLAKTKELTQEQINRMAQDNFEHEMRRHKDFFLKHGIFVLIYTDTDLSNLPKVFDDMKRHLEPGTRSAQLRFDLIHEFFGTT